MPEKPSFLTSTTAISFLIVVAGAVGYAWWTKNNELVIKLVDMIVPAFLMSKGIKLGSNGGSKPSEPSVPVITP